MNLKKNRCPKNAVKVFVKSVMLNRNSVLPRNVRNVRK